MTTRKNLKNRKRARIQRAIDRLNIKLSEVNTGPLTEDSVKDESKIRKELLILETVIKKLY